MDRLSLPCKLLPRGGVSGAASFPTSCLPASGQVWSLLGFLVP